MSWRGAMFAVWVSLAPCMPALGQQADIPLIGYLSGGELTARKAWLAAFHAGMRELGYVEGEDYRLEARGAAGKFETLPALAQELLAMQPRVILASTTPGALAAKNATRTVPVVFVAVGDPVGAGVVSNLARPSGNVTGLSNSSVELPGKRLDLLKDLLPDAKRVAVFVNPDDANAGLQIARTKEAAAALGLELAPFHPIRRAEDLDAGFEAALRAGAQAVLRLVDPLSGPLRRRTADLALKYRLPVVYAFREDALAGGLASYGTSQAEVYRRAASFVHRILTGTPTGEIPVEQPTRFELVINLKTAKAFGLSLPEAVLARADEVIE